MNWKRLVQDQRATPNRTITPSTPSRSVGLGISAEKRQPIPMETSREQGLMGAGRTIRQGARSQRLVLGERASNSDRNLEAVRRGRRGATR